MPLLMAETNSSAGAESKAPAKRIGTLLAQSEDLQKAEDELNLASVEVELKDINRKMMATLRRRRKLMKEFKDLSGGKDRDDFQRPLTSYCTAEEYDMEHAFRRMRVWSRGKAKYVEDSTVIHVRTASRFDEDEEEEEDPEGEGDVFIFPYGVVVCWGMTEEQQAELLTVMNFCAIDGYIEPEEDDFTYSYGDNFDFVYSQDELILCTKPSLDEEQLQRSVLEKLAASHAFAQSSKLSSFAESIQKSIEDTRGLAEELAYNGEIISQSQRDIARNMGRLILDRHTIYLYADVLDTPDVCWENPDLDPLYRKVNTFLELKPRVDLLNSRVEVVRELLSVLSDELHSKHASRLEEIIIWLITVEILIEMVKDIVPLANQWVQKQLSQAASTASLSATPVVAAGALQGLLVTGITLTGIFIGVTVFSGLYYWWSVRRPKAGMYYSLKKLIPPMPPRRPPVEKRFR